LQKLILESRCEGEVVVAVVDGDVDDVDADDF
jgi:hypothetical protein